MGEKFEAIGTMIFLLFIIIVFVIIAVHMFVKEIKITEVMARKIEIIGYIILFILVIWEFVVKDIVMEPFYNADFFYIKQKMDCIFYLIQDIRQGAAINERSIFDTYINSRQGDYIQYQMKFVDGVIALFQIVSAICIAIGRYYELISRKDEN